MLALCTDLYETELLKLKKSCFLSIVIGFLNVEEGGGHFFVY